MSALREASVAFARKGAHPLLSVERLFATERAAAGLESRRIGLAERGLATELRRRLGDIWGDRQNGRLANDLVERLIRRERRSADRALIAAYLLDYPVDHPAFPALREAVAIAADRHAWRWQEAGRRWRLWEGPNSLGEALRVAPDPQALLREAGFVGRLAEGAFVSAARADAERSAR